MAGSMPALSELQPVERSGQAGLNVSGLPCLLNRPQWVVKSSLSVIDQGVFSGATFALNFALARILPPVEYGTFSVAFASFLFLSGFSNSLVLEPMSVFGPSRYRNALGTYFNSLLWMQVIVTGAVALLGCLATVWMPLTLASTFRMMSLAGPPVLMLWLVRRAAYVSIDPAAAFLASGTYFLAMIVAILALIRHGHLWSGSGFVAMALAGTTAALANWKRLGMPLPATLLSVPVRRHLSAFREHWDYGRWLVIGSVLWVAIGQLQVLFAAWLGLEAAGVLRAMMNFVVPMGQVFTAMATLGTPVLSRHFGLGETDALRRKGYILTVSLTALACVYELALWGGGPWLEKFCYGGKFAGYVWLLPILGLQPVFGAAASGYLVILRAVQRPRDYVLACAVSAPIALLTSALLVYLWGLRGAAMSVATTAFVVTVIVFHFTRRALARTGREVKQD